jgi:hypothetical protein
MLTRSMYSHAHFFSQTSLKGRRLLRSLSSVGDAELDWYPNLQTEKASCPRSIVCAEGTGACAHFMFPVRGFRAMVEPPQSGSANANDNALPDVLSNQFPSPENESPPAPISPKRSPTRNVAPSSFAGSWSNGVVLPPIPVLNGNLTESPEPIRPTSRVSQFFQQIPDLSFMLASTLTLPSKAKP